VPDPSGYPAHPLIEEIEAVIGRIDRVWAISSECHIIGPLFWTRSNETSHFFPTDQRRYFVLLTAMPAVGKWISVMTLSLITAPVAASYSPIVAVSESGINFSKKSLLPSHASAMLGRFLA